jgi:hypothetical protein
LLFYLFYSAYVAQSQETRLFGCNSTSDVPLRLVFEVVLQLIIQIGLGVRTPEERSHSQSQAS